MPSIYIDNTKVMAKGQVVLSQKIREALGVQTGDGITFISHDNHVIMMNSAVYAMKMLQDSMEGEAEKVGIKSPEDVVNILHELHSGDEA